MPHECKVVSEAVRFQVLESSGVALISVTGEDKQYPGIWKSNNSTTIVCKNFIPSPLEGGDYISACFTFKTKSYKHSTSGIFWLS